LNIFGKLHIIANSSALGNNCISSKEIGEFYDIIDVVIVFDVVGSIDHAHIIEDIVFSEDDL
jgi:hypothetical protein